MQIQILFTLVPLYKYQAQEDQFLEKLQLQQGYYQSTFFMLLQTVLLNLRQTQASQL